MWLDSLGVGLTFPTKPTLKFDKGIWQGDVSNLTSIWQGDVSFVLMSYNGETIKKRSETCIYDIMFRGTDKRNIFLDKEDKIKF